MHTKVHGSSPLTSDDLVYFMAGLGFPGQSLGYMDYNVAFEEPREFLLKYAAESDWPGPGLSCQTSEAAYDSMFNSE